MKKVLYASGDSFVFGMECKSDHSRDPENKNLSFPKYLSDMLRCETYINNSYNGATNEFIFRKTLFDLDDLESKGINPKDVFVVVGITSLHRLEIDGNRFFEQVPQHFLKQISEHPMFPIEHYEYGTIFSNPGFNFGVTHYKSGTSINVETEIVPWASQFIWTETVQMKSQEARLIALHQFLQSRGYDHIFVNTVCALKRTTEIDTSNKNFYKLDSGSFYEWAKEHYPEHLRKYNHFSTVPHSEYAKELFNYIDDKIILH